MYNQEDRIDTLDTARISAVERGEAIEAQDTLSVAAIQRAEAI